MKDAPTIHRLEYALYLAAKATVHRLPHTAARSLGAALGDLVFHVARERRHVAVANLRRALPELDSGERRRIARLSFRSLGATLFDVVSSLRLDAVELCRRLTIEGWEHVDRVDRLGKGTLALSAHLGTWEIAAYPLGLYRSPLHVVNRPADNPHLNREVVRLRERFGNVSIAKRGAVRQMIKVLRTGGRVGVLLDQRVLPNEGIRVPFFGLPAMTSTAPARLSLKSGAPALPLFGYLEPRGTYRVVFREPIAPEGEGEEAARKLTERYLQRTETEIRHQPELWMWMHRRWD